MMYPLVEDLAAEGVEVVTSCRVLGFSTQAFYKWRKRPYSDSEGDDAHLINALVDLHADDPEFGYRFLHDELVAAGQQGRRESGASLVPPEPAVVGVRQEERSRPQGRPTGA